jgi:hypothetical protein
MAEQMKWLKRPRDSGWTRLYYDLAVAFMMAIPAVDLVFSWLNIRTPARDDLWTYGSFVLIGLACILTVIIRLLDQVRVELRSMTFVLYQLLKEPDEEEEVISLATYQRLRERLGLD